MSARASAPGKAILLGEHFVVHGSGAILCAIDRRVTATAEEARPPRAQGGWIERECLERAGASVTFDSEIPAGVGLGSSSACCVAAACAVRALGGGAHDAAEVERSALEIERAEFPGASGADTAACARGGIIEFGGGRARSIDARIMLVVANTGSEHDTRKIVGMVGQTRRRDEEAFGALRDRVAGLVSDSARALRRGDLVALGRMMSENQECLEQIGVSSPALRRAVAAMSEAGYGAKLTGAGGGGCAIALVDEDGAGRALAAAARAGADAFTACVDERGVINL